MQDWRAAIVLPKVFAWVEFRRMKFEHNRVAGMLVLSVAFLGAVGWPQAPPSSVLSLARSPDGKRLATGSNEGAAKNVWDAEKDKEFGRPTVTLGIEISLPDRAVFYIPVFKVKVVRAYVPPPGGFHHPYANSSAFCGCNFPEPRSIISDGRSASGVAGTSFYPDAGKCVQISGCGQCCRISPP